MLHDAYLDPEAQVEPADKWAHSLTEVALDAYKQGVSYRNMRVGAAALVLYTSESMKRGIVVCGANFKPVPYEGALNLHAEDVVAAFANALKKPDETLSIPVIAVVGDVQPDQQSGKVTPTLHPCGLCRDKMTHGSLPLAPESIIITQTPDGAACEQLTLDELIELHATSD